jgi:hypothetical protein
MKRGAGSQADVLPRMTPRRLGSLIASLAVIGFVVVQELAIAPRFGGHPGGWPVIYDLIAGGFLAGGLWAGAKLAHRTLTPPKPHAPPRRRSTLPAAATRLLVLGISALAVAACLYSAYTRSSEPRIDYLGQATACGSPLAPQTSGCGSIATAGLIVIGTAAIAMIGFGYLLAAAKLRAPNRRLRLPRAAIAISVTLGLALLAIAALIMTPNRPLVPTAADDATIAAFAHDIRLGTIPLAAGIALLTTTAIALRREPDGYPWFSVAVITALTVLLRLVLAVTWIFLVLGFINSQ